MGNLSFRLVKIIVVASCSILAALIMVIMPPAHPMAKISSDASFTYTQAIPGFSVFAKPAGTGDALPSNSVYAGSTARRIGGSNQPFSAWVVLDNSQLCVTVNASSGPAAGGPAACNTLSRLTRPGQILILGAGTGNGATPQLLAGLVPDGVASVTVYYQNGTTVAAPVHNNGFALETGGLAPQSLRLDDSCPSQPKRGDMDMILNDRKEKSPVPSCADVPDSISLASMNQQLIPSYTGEFCYGVLLDDGNTCQSNTVSNIRRAVGHGSDYTFVDVSGGGLSKYASCHSDGCTADTGYLSRDVTGHGLIENSGPCNCTGYYYGYLYA